MMTPLIDQTNAILIEEAANFFIKQQRVSCSLLQAQFRLPYRQAMHLTALAREHLSRSGAGDQVEWLERVDIPLIRVVHADQQDVFIGTVSAQTRIDRADSWDWQCVAPSELAAQLTGVHLLFVLVDGDMSHLCADVWWQMATHAGVVRVVLVTHDDELPLALAAQVNAVFLVNALGGKAAMLERLYRMVSPLFASEGVSVAWDDLVSALMPQPILGSPCPVQILPFVVRVSAGVTDNARADEIVVALRAIESLRWQSAGAVLVVLRGHRDQLLGREVKLVTAALKELVGENCRLVLSVLNDECIAAEELIVDGFLSSRTSSKFSQLDAPTQAVRLSDRSTQRRWGGFL